MYARNPVWKASTDPIRKAYVNEIVVSETGNQPTVSRSCRPTPRSADMEFDAFPPLDAVPGLV